VAENHIGVILEETKPIQIREPYIKSEAFESELLKCMVWSEADNQFDNDGSCSFQLMEDMLPCDDCGGNEIVSVVSNCKCTHMSVFSVVYSETSIGAGLGPTIGIYSDFFALNYWSQSFGYYAVISGISVLLFGHFIIYFVDGRLQEKTILKIREKVKKIEAKAADGGKSNKFNKKSLVEMNEEEDDDKQTLKPGGRKSRPGEARSTVRKSNGFMGGSRTNGFGSSKGPTRKRLPKKSKVKKE
jgi:hypothetical protein